MNNKDDFAPQITPMPDSQPHQLDDAALVKQAKAGDSQAFGLLYERYAASIYRFLNAQLRDNFTAEDLTSDVFLRAWHSLPRYRERGHPFSAYLFRIARNSLIDYWRKLKVDATQSLERLKTRPADSTNPDDLITKIQESQRIRVALANLKGDYRSVLVLRFINGLSPGEVSQIMERSEGSIRVLQHRALKALRKILLESGFNHV
jgi:RNA polymerase sigma-70 factor (ECF subfamily)